MIVAFLDGVRCFAGSVLAVQLQHPKRLQAPADTTEARLKQLPASLRKPSAVWLGDSRYIFRALQGKQAGLGLRSWSGWISAELHKRAENGCGSVCGSGSLTEQSPGLASSSPSVTPDNTQPLAAGADGAAWSRRPPQTSLWCNLSLPEDRHPG
nr:uncharacterized protein LOC110364630 isoform X3 [Columba livia]